MPKHRMGDLTTTAIGERLLPSEIHLDSLQLELRGPDGRVIPTEWIDVRDTEFAAALSRDLGSFDEQLRSEEEDPEVLAAVEHDSALLEEWFGKKEPSGFWDDYDEDGDGPLAETPSFPQYQIQVGLVDDSSVL